MVGLKLSQLALAMVGLSLIPPCARAQSISDSDFLWVEPLVTVIPDGTRDTSFTVAIMIRSTTVMGALNIPLSFAGHPGLKIDTSVIAVPDIRGVTFGPAGKASNWTIKTSRVDNNHQTIRLSLIDNGAGIDPLNDTLCYLHFAVDRSSWAGSVTLDSTTIGPAYPGSSLSLTDVLANVHTPTWTPGAINIFRPVAPPGDVDASGEVSSSDVIGFVNYLFRRTPLPGPDCVADVNADSVTGLLDIVCLINFVFRKGPELLDGCQVPWLDFWPLSKGNYWIYDCDSDHPWCGHGPFLQLDVTEQSADSAMVVRTWIQWGSADTLILRERDHLVEWRRPGGGWELFCRFEDSTMWLHRDPFFCNDGVLYSNTREPEPIITPAATFSGCLRVTLNPIPYRCSDAGTGRQWWAPGVGLVSWYEGHIAGAIHYELIDYGVVLQR